LTHGRLHGRNRRHELGQLTHLVVLGLGSLKCLTRGTVLRSGPGKVPDRVLKPICRELVLEVDLHQLLAALGLLDVVPLTRRYLLAPLALFLGLYGVELSL
jgi:hypothetical protein